MNAFLRIKLIAFCGMSWVASLNSILGDDSAVSLDLGAGIKLDLVQIVKGEFEQGSPIDEANRGQDESRHHVSISQDFFIGKYPVTRGQFARFVSETGYRTEAERGTSGGFGFDGKALAQSKNFNWRNPGFPQTDDHPVCLVTYADSLAFANWLSRKSARRISLPTEAQWEYACRAGSVTPYYNGATTNDCNEIAWHKFNAGHGTQPVGQKKPNAWGLYDMCGNVHQWCLDWYAPYPQGPSIDPQAPQLDNSNPARRVLRGGSWLRDPVNCRSAARSRNTPGTRNADNGFRVIAFASNSSAGSLVPPPSTQFRPSRPTFASRSALQNFNPVPEFQTQTSHRIEVMALAAGGIVIFAGLIFCVVVWRIFSAFSSRRRFLARPSANDLPPIIGSDSIIEPDDPPIFDDPQIADDGFWIATDAAAAGSIIHYQYISQGKEQDGEITFDPGPDGQFIYTGAPPSNVRILDVAAPDKEPPVADPDAVPPLLNSPISSPPEMVSPSAFGPPPAY